MQKNSTSNLIMESSFIEKIKQSVCGRADGYSEESFGGVKVCRIIVDDAEAQNKYSCERGNYITLYTPKLYECDTQEKAHISRVLSAELSRLLCRTLRTDTLSGCSVLIAGVGNREISSDSIGPLTCEKINVTRHIALLDRDMFTALGTCSVSALSCGVMGQTGISTAELLRGAVAEIKPDILIAVDALSARARERLGATVQLSDTGICPGAGIGNRGEAINADALGIPVLAVGVPSVISAATLVCDILNECNVLEERTETILKAQKNFFVAPKECDLLSRAASEVLSDALNKSLGGI